MRIYLASANLDASSALQLARLDRNDHRIVGHDTYIRPLLKNIGQKKPDLLLLEWGLPFLAGAGPSEASDTLIATLRNVNHNMRIVVIGTPPAMAEQARAAGADDLIDRPDSQSTAGRSQSRQPGRRNNSRPEHRSAAERLLAHKRKTLGLSAHPN